MIQPTVGRIVWYRPGPGDVARHSIGEPLAAIIVHVWSESLVNLTVFDANGQPQPRTSVPLVQDATPPIVGAYAEWMPYQLGQAAKAAELEQQLKAG